MFAPFPTVMGSLLITMLVVGGATALGLAAPFVLIAGAATFMGLVIIFMDTD